MTTKNVVLVTGAAGFIGYHLSLRLLREGFVVIGVDNINNYYDVNLKKDRLSQLLDKADFHFYEKDIADVGAMEKVFSSHQIDYVVNLAAQAGVRYSLENPQAYISANLVGFTNVLEGCRHNGVKHLLYASSSSVYGANTKQPFSVHHNVDHPISLYAASKKANELIAHSYANNFGLPVTGLRFFTVYGPWGRPDMALFLFTKAIIEGNAIDVFNNGQMSRDFTYIDDIVEGVFRVLKKVPKGDQSWNSDEPDPSTSYAPFQIFNIGSNRPSSLMDFIDLIEDKVGKKANKNFLPMQTGDVPSTYADVENLMKTVDYKPDTPLEEGIGNFVDWYRNYYKV